jgi:hypothetical protein
MSTASQNESKEQDEQLKTVLLFYEINIKTN